MCSRQNPNRKFKTCRRYNVPGDAHSLIPFVADS